MRSRKLKVLIDGRKLSSGGIGGYTTSLIDGLNSIPDISITLLMTKGETLFDRWRGNVIPVPVTSGLYSFNELFKLGKFCNSLEWDVFHEPHYTVPWFLNRPSIATIHDLIHINAPQRWYYPYIARRLIGSALKRATRIVTVSNASKEEILSFCPSVAEKIFVIPNSIRDAFLYGGERSSQEAPYIVAVFSMLKPHKGLQDLLDAFELIAAQYPSLRLLLVGKGFEKNDQAFNLPNRVEILGVISDKALAALYRNAEALVVSSKAEGFCIPLIEAHACGTPVVVRPLKVFDELLSPYDICARDWSIPSFARAIEEILTHPRRYPVNLFQVQYTAQSMAVSTAQIYEEVVSRKVKDVTCSLREPSRKVVGM